MFQLHVDIDLEKYSAASLPIIVGNSMNYHMVQHHWPIYTQREGGREKEGKREGGRGKKGGKEEREHCIHILSILKIYTQVGQ